MSVAFSFSRHPLSAIYGTMPEHEVDALAGDIKVHGLLDPITLFESQILDGWHRYIACEKAGVEPAYTEFPIDGDPIQFVRARNHLRRHSTEGQRSIIEVKLSQYAQSGRPKNRADVPGLRTNAEMAAAAEVSERTIKNAKAAVSAGLDGAVTEGVLSVSRAAEIAKTEPKVAQKIATAVAAGDMAAARKAAELPSRPNAANDSPAPDDVPDLAELVDELQAENKRLSDIVSADDKAVEALKWRAAYDRALASQSEAMDAAARSEKREKFAMQNLRRCGKAVGEDDPRKIASAVEAAVGRKAA